MSRPRQHPTLTRQFCFDQRVLRGQLDSNRSSTLIMSDFLRLSRSTIDDSIFQNLNALVRNSTFDPTSTSSRQNQSSPPNPHQLPTSTCEEFISSILFPSWSTRDDVIKYCLTVALDPLSDETDPSTTERALEDQVAAGRTIDERLDPYSGRYFPQKTKREALLDLLQNEVAVETIIRDRSRRAIEERCVDGRGKADARSYNAWRPERGSKRLGHER
jgi:hypothetical protein